jgi:general secretion pathway protein G
VPGKRKEPRVFFPWERRRGVHSLLGRGRVRQALLVGCAAAGFLVLNARERRAGEVRATRAQITMADTAITAWRADHDRSCPGSLAEVVSGGYLHEVPRDAWGRPLRVACPGRLDPAGFDVSSDGPDGEPGGRDRVQ